MTLEEAIKHLTISLDDKEHNWGCKECRQEHEQLLEFLVELDSKRDLCEMKDRRIKDQEKEFAFLKETIQGKDQRIHYLLGQIAAYEKILFCSPFHKEGD